MTSSITKTADNQFYLVLDNYDSDNKPQGILIVSGSPGSYVSPYYWDLDSKTNVISQKTAVAGTAVMDMFIDWDSLPDYVGADSLISAEYGSKPISRKYVIVPNQDIIAGRVYISKSAFDSKNSVWSSWKVNSSGDIPPFAADNSFLSTDVIVDKAEFTYSGKSLTINTTTVDFLSIPMTVEAIFNVAVTWGSQRGPMGIRNSLSTVAAAFTALATKNGIDWSNLNVSNSSTVDRILSPFRYLDGSPSDASAWNSHFDDYISALTTLFDSGIQYPIVDTYHGSGYFIGKTRVSNGNWVIDAYGKDGTTLVKSDFFTVDPSTFTGNSKAVFAVDENNVGARDILAGINRGIAHINDNIKGWANIFGTDFPATTANPTGQWTPSDWTNSASYYPGGKLSSGTEIAANRYSQLLHEQSITGSASNRTAAPFPTAVNDQNYCYGFSVDDIWTHGSAVYGQGVDGNGNGTTISATISIFKQS